ncbi:MAG: TIGR04211 family SH3 domain-containing protein [Thioalkalispiraceae bacterium]|jgi:SH3 domain protein
MRNCKTILTSLMLVCLLPLQAYAATKYVTDHLIITMRSGQGNQFEIIKTLPSGTRLEILEETDTGYTMVRLEDGTEGWVRTQYLSDEPIAADKLAAAETKANKLQATNKLLRQELDALKKAKRKLDQEHASLQSDHKAVTEELTHLNEVAARPKQLEVENKDLRKRFEQISDELVLIKQENQVLKDRSERNWFIAGAAVLILGMIIGLIIPKFRFQKKDKWGSY